MLLLMEQKLIHRGWERGSSMNFDDEEGMRRRIDRKGRAFLSNESPLFAQRMIESFLFNSLLFYFSPRVIFDWIKYR